MARQPRRFARVGAAADLPNAAAFDAYVGPAGEITVDHIRGIIALHNGSTAGGLQYLVGGGGADIDFGTLVSKGTLAGSDKILLGDSADSDELKQSTVKALRAASVNSVSAVYTASTNLSGVIPYDDSPPQSSEGDQILTVSITPSSPLARLRATFSGWGVHNTAAVGVCAALFLDSESAARRATVSASASAGSPFTFAMAYEFSPGDELEHTFKIRTGIPNLTGGATYRLNGSSGARVYGGASACVLTVEEV